MPAGTPSGRAATGFQAGPPAALPGRVRWAAVLDFVGSVPFGVALLVLILAYCWIGSAGTAPFGNWFVRQAFEKTEMEWFAWWPFQVLLGTLALSLILVTWRRIPFTLPKLGVWVIHSGVLVLMAGAAIYFGSKREGDIVLFKGGPAAGQFFLHDRWALYLRHAAGPWSELRLSGLPRYREALADPAVLIPAPGDPLPAARPLSITPQWAADPGLLQQSLELRVTGFVPYAHLVESWEEGGEADFPFVAVSGELAGRPFREVLFPADPRRRKADLGPGVVELRAAWVATKAELRKRLNPGPPLLRAGVRGGNSWAEVPLAEAMARETAVPGTGYRIRAVHYDPHWTVLTARGEEPAARVVVQVAGPAGVFSRAVVAEGKREPVDFDSRGAMLPRTVDERLAIELSNVPESGLWVLTGPAGEHALFVSDGGQVLHHPLRRGGRVEFLGGRLILGLVSSGPRSRRVARPQLVGRAERDAKAGAAFALVRVEARWEGGKTALWVPYTPYTFPTRMGFRPAVIEGPGGRQFEILFSRQTHPLPVQVALEDFQLETFPGGTRERDFISLVRFFERGAWTRVHKIHSNNPTGFAGWWFFQSTWDPPDPAAGYPGLQFTGLGVGNRHGVGVMLAGGLMTVLGTIWAFYVKPLILKRRIARGRAVSRAAAAAGLACLFAAGPAQAGEVWPLSVPAAFAESLDLQGFRLAAVQEDGRLKTVDSLARERLKLVNNSRAARRMDPVVRYLDLALAPDHYAAAPLIHLRKPAVRRSLIQGVRGLVPAAERQGLLAAAELERIERGGWAAPVFFDHPQVEAVVRAMERDLRGTARDAAEIRTARALADPGVLVSLLCMVPPVGGGQADPWSPVGRPGITPAGAFQPAQAWDDLRAAWQAHDAARANQALRRLVSGLAALEPRLYPAAERRAWEHWYYKNNKLTFTWVIYFLALPFFLMAAVYGFRWARASGLALFGAAFALHTLSIGLRWVLAGRIPNANMFEAVTASAWLGGAAALVLERVLRRWPYRNFPALAASAYAMTGLMIGRFMPVAINSDITTVMPVLDRTIWLYIHTNIIIGSYALIFFGAVTALLYLGGRAAAAWLPGPRLALAWGGVRGAGPAVGGAASLMVGRGVQPGDGADSGLARTLDGATMIFLELAFITLWLGTILGAVWADVSWGRPWGWDPKEVFALNTWIVFLILVHVRLKARDKALWTAILAVIGCAVMLFNWIAVNFVIVGLHSYA